MSDIVWEDPPPDARGRGNHAPWKRLAEELQLHPGKWALVADHAQTISAFICLRKHGCEARSVRNEDNTYNIYARWPEDAS